MGIMLITGFSFAAVASAQELVLDAVQPTVAGSLSSASETAKAGDASGEAAVYIVRLSDPAVATYEGGVQDFAATSIRVTGHRKLDVNSSASQAYSAFLRDSQDAFVADCEAALGHSIDVPHSYQYAYNGVAMVLTEDEAKTVGEVAGVKSIERERMEVPMTDAGPEWIGAKDVWRDPHGSQGEGAVIAILDTGINSDHPSFAAVSGDGYEHKNPLGHGNYVPGSYCDTTDPYFCNDKLIGAWSFVPGDVNYPVPEDSDDHGSHTASTAAGNKIANATLYAPTTSMTRKVSGVAPRANIIAYDVCVVSCPGSALLAAVDQVVIDASNLPDGIHALNYSISGGNSPYNDSVEIGFLNATAAGVYVATSAGNAGPGAATTGHNSPWVSATGASTHNRKIENSVVEMTSDGDSLADIVGAGFTSAYGPAKIINSADLEADYPGSTLCGLGVIGDFNPPWPAGTFNGEIVACTRGTFGRVEKGSNALAAGAGGYILMDNGSGIVGDAHVLPGVHITQADGAVLADWLANNENPMGSIAGFSLSLDDANGDIMAGFSSRGPNSSIDVLKPDVAAPGVNVMAAVSSFTGVLAPEYGFLSGTSMASPHNAGAGALLAAATDWTPMEIKSALMLTSGNARTLKEDGVTPTDHFDVGAGRIDVSRALKTGLVMDETPLNMWLANPALGGDPKSLNLASMQDGNCVGKCGWIRTVRNPHGHPARYKLHAHGPAGLVFNTIPSGEIVVPPYGTAEIKVGADTALAAGGWNFAQLDMYSKGYGPDLHMPIAIHADTSTDINVLSKTVDAASAAKGEPLNYTINITNGLLAGEIEMIDTVPKGVKVVSGSLSATVTKGQTTSPFHQFSHDKLGWRGELELAELNLSEEPAPFGYLPMSLFTAPFGCPSNCDDGAWIVNVPAFTYNGETHSSVIWSVNGTLEAGTDSLLATSFANQNLPDATAPNNIMAPMWTDLDMGADGDGAEWYVAVLSDGVNLYTIYEWENVPLWGSDTERFTFQIWVQNDDSGNVWFVYAQLGDLNAQGMTVGVENSFGNVGDSYYYNGTGTAPAIGTDLKVNA
ncbi:MAG: S8 family serine peptidase, partial [Gammaproteobacteria bacterium]|nr:S8 family serine peptidase [Gammaproteobacteria bacterium]